MVATSTPAACNAVNALGGARKVNEDVRLDGHRGRDSAWASMLRERVPTEADVNRMAEHLRVNPSTVYNWRAGRRAIDLKTIFEITAYLEITPNDLLGVTTPKRANWIELAAEAEDVVSRLEHVFKAMQEAVSEVSSLLSRIPPDGIERSPSPPNSRRKRKAIRLVGPYARARS